MMLFDKHNLNSKEEIKISEESLSDIDENKQDTQNNRNSLQIDPDVVLDLLEEFYMEKKNKAKEQCKNKNKFYENFFFLLKINFFNF
jgi:hypothetical protein